MWIAVCTHPNRETLAIDNLRRQGYEIYCPMLAKSWRHARKVQTVKRPLFPGYIFVSLNQLAQGIHSIHSTFGVRHLVKFGDAPARLPENFITELKAREVDGVIPLPSPETSFPPGSAALIREGAFKDMVVTVLSCQVRDRVIVLLDLLKSSVKTSVPVDYLERA